MPYSSETLNSVARQCQQVARHFGDRQNRDTTLTAVECQAVVTRMLNAGNILEQLAREQSGIAPPPVTEEQSCDQMTVSSPPPTPATSPPT